MTIKKVGISMPVSNEEDTIGNFLDGLLQEISLLKSSYSITCYIVMDRSSKDNTYNIVKNIAAKDQSIKLIFYEEAKNAFVCYLKGFRCALEDKCDYIIEMDSGGSHPPSKLKDIIFALDVEDFDVVFPSRFMGNGGTSDHPFYRRMISRGGTIFANLWLGTNYNDATSGFHAFKASVLNSFNLDAFISTCTIYSTELKYYCSGYRIKEIPFVYKGSSSTFKIKIIFTALKQLFAIKYNKKNVVRISSVHRQ